MSCNNYQLYWLGDMSELDFTNHKSRCRECAQAWELDSLVDAQAKEIAIPEMSADMWLTIVARQQEKADVTEKLPQKRASILSGIFDPRQHTTWKLAALLVISIGVSVYSINRTSIDSLSGDPRNLLTFDALSRVESAEQEYVQAICDLETSTEVVVTEIDTELMLRYRSRLETIDSQIARCKKALANDRANAHVQRYLLAAYQDKKETLTELAALKQRQPAAKKL